MITVKGVRFDSVTIAKEGDATRVTGRYSLISSTDSVLATNDFNGYQGVQVVFSPATLQALRDFVKAAKSDLETILGLNEGDAK